MYKILRSDKDSYITNKVVKTTRQVSSNVGQAGTLDLYKLYGVTYSGSSPNIELSRLLIHFDLNDIKKNFDQNNIDIDHESFWSKLVLKDVYGGQTTPANFTVEVFPLSSSFDEGYGKDVAFYSDKDVCNWLSSSRDQSWYLTGCSLAVSGTEPGDYIIETSDLVSLKTSQFFKIGDEDLVVDITKIVSSTIAQDIPDEGFRISLSSSHENDNKTYFVKRFSSRNAYDETRRPSIIYGFDDSVADDTLNLAFDTTCSINLYNYVQGFPRNIISGSTEISSSNCTILKLSAENKDFYFTGSQFSRGKSKKTGVYSADVYMSSADSDLSKIIISSGSVSFDQMWLSLDLSLTYSLGSKVTFFPPERSGSTKIDKKYTVNITNLQESYLQDDNPELRVHIFDYSSPFMKVTKVPVELPGTVLKSAYYRVRDVATNEEIIPFDIDKNSTKISSDSSGMFFRLFTENLTKKRTYVVDIMLVLNGNKRVFQNASSIFRID